MKFTHPAVTVRTMIAGRPIDYSFGPVELLGLPEQLVLDVLRKGARRVQRRLGLRHRLRERLQDDLLLGRLAESRPRDPDLFLVDEPPVEDALVLPVAQNLDRVADVHYDGVRDAFRRDPFALVEELQAGNHVVEDEGEGAYVGVGLDAQGELRLRAFWVVVDFHLDEVFVLSANFCF